jgi:hypothetical protein
MAENKSLRKYTDVSGNERVYNYDQKQYNKKYYETHKNELKEKVICPVCNGKYSIYSYSTHCKTKKHKMARIEKKLVEEPTPQFKTKLTKSEIDNILLNMIEN